MDKNWTIVVILMMMLIFVGCEVNEDEENNFVKLDLSQYKEIVFDEVVIDKALQNGDSFFKRSKDKKQINDLLSYFKGLELINYDHKKIPKDHFRRYDLRFINRSTYEELSIYILDKDYIEIYTNRVIKVKDQKKNMIEYKHNRDIQRYKVINNAINLKALENTLNELEGEWDKL